MPPIDATSETLRRAEIMNAVAEHVAAGMSVSSACAKVGVSPATFGRWQKRYEQGGVKALAPQYENCGRKPLAVPTEEELRALRSLTMQSNRGDLTVSTTAAARLFAQTDACSEELREAILKPRASKHTLTPTIRNAMRVDKAVIREHRSPGENSLRYATSPGQMRMNHAAPTRRRLFAGERQSWDDGSINFMVCVPWPWGGCKISDKFGVRLGRFQLLTGIDDASNYCPGFGFTIREMQSYRAVDVMAAMGRVWSNSPMPERVVLERGVWEAHRVSRFLGAAGVEIERAYTPNHKLVERFFHSLWTKLSFQDGQIGRYRGEMERENKLLMSAQAGRLDPKEHFPMLEKAMDALEAAIAMQNAEPVESRQYGTWVPQQRWEDDLAENARPMLTSDLGWMWAPDVKEWTVRFNGLVGGRVPSLLGHSLPYYFSTPELYRYEGRKVRVYFDTADPFRATLELVERHHDQPAGTIITHVAECVSEAPTLIRMAEGYVTDLNAGAMQRGIDMRKRILGSIRHEYRTLAPGGKRTSKTSVARGSDGRTTEISTQPAPERLAPTPRAATPTAAPAPRRKTTLPDTGRDRLAEMERALRESGELLLP